MKSRLTRTSITPNLEIVIRLSIDLEPLFALYRSRGADTHKPLLKHAVALESAGVDGVVIGTGGEYDPGRRRLVTALSESLDVALAVRTSTNQQWLEILQEIKPSMAIFHFDGSGEDTLKDIVTKMQVQNILVAFEIEAEIEMVKKAARLKSDFLVFDCHPYLSAASLGDQIEQLNRISKSAALASRLSMGCVAAGDFDRQRLQRLIETKSIEEIILGLPVYTDSLLGGYRDSITAMKRPSR